MLLLLLEKAQEMLMSFLEWDSTAFLFSSVSVHSTKQNNTIHFLIVKIQQ